VAQDGIAKRHLKDGSVRWDVVVDLGPDPVTGKRRQRKQTFKNQREAKAFRTARLAQIAQGTAVDRSNQTVGELLDYWLEKHARHEVRDKTYECYEQTIRVHLKPGLGAIRVQKLTSDQIKTFYADKLNAGCGKRTVELCHRRLSQVLTMAVELGLVARNVAQPRSVSPPRARAREMQTWDMDQVQRFLAAASQSGYGPRLGGGPGDRNAAWGGVGAALAGRGFRAPGAPRPSGRGPR
jgi:hypothetical protein